MILTFRFLMQMTLREVGSRIGRNASRVVQIQKKALRKIRRYNGLSRTWPDSICDEQTSRHVPY